MRTYGRVGVTALLLIMSVVTVIAMSPSHTFESAVQTTSISSPDANAMRVYLDPETGDLTSTPPADAVITVDPEMEHLLRHDSEGLTQVTNPDGGVFLQNDGRYGDVLVVRIGENGKMTLCVNDAKAYADAINDKTSPTGPEVK
jgi:hypothetical protein